ncbi:hypothetical protein RvY_11303 [Ramazzottius varieornatus]|uniref:Uncharacterized protein n=1 Tax=Ramazzottius varieornatus TaxID=947166 RepID=A0A1D1VFR1_RAMVA|nr:hypothetical protein RvY_11303 [Ramazzottius varieornatus]
MRRPEKLSATGCQHQDQQVHPAVIHWCPANSVVSAGFPDRVPDPSPDIPSLTEISVTSFAPSSSYSDTPELYGRNPFSEKTSTDQEDIQQYYTISISTPLAIMLYWMDQRTMTEHGWTLRYRFEIPGFQYPGTHYFRDAVPVALNPE